MGLSAPWDDSPDIIDLQPVKNDKYETNEP